MASNMFLYWGSGSVPCWKPMLVLAEKGFSGYPNKLVSFSNKENKTDDILAINPRGQVPTFKDGNVNVNESGAICEYLERTYSGQGTQLFPSDSGELATVLQRMYETTNLEQSLIKNLVLYFFMTKAEDQEQSKIDEKMAGARKEVTIWEGYMQQNGSGSFIAGKNFTMADCLFFPYIAFGVRLGLNLDEKFPALAEYYNRVKNRDSVKKTWPPHWSAEPSKMTKLSAI